MNDSEGNPRYVFCIFKTNVADTLQTNYTRCVNANIQSITIKYAGNTYPHLTQNANWTNNEFSKFY